MSKSIGNEYTYNIQISKILKDNEVRDFSGFII